MERTRISLTKRVILAQKRDVKNSKRDLCVRICMFTCIHMCIAALDGAHEDITHKEGNTGTEKRRKKQQKRPMCVYMYVYMYSYVYRST